VPKYAGILSTADPLIGQIIAQMDGDDILVVMADHGNDPTIGHPHHTREYVPLMICGPNVKPGTVGLRSTLSDTGATAADYFSVTPPQNGTSFLPELLGQSK